MKQKEFLEKYREELDALASENQTNLEIFLRVLNKNEEINEELFDIVEEYISDEDIFEKLISYIPLNASIEWFNLLIECYALVEGNPLDLEDYAKCLKGYYDNGIDIKVVEKYIDDKYKCEDLGIELTKLIDEKIEAQKDDLEAAVKEDESEEDIQKDKEDVVEEVKDPEVTENIENTEVVENSVESASLFLSLLQNNSKDNVLKALDNVCHLMMIIKDESYEMFHEMIKYKAEYQDLLSKYESSQNELKRLEKKLNKTQNELKEYKEKYNGMKKFIS